MPNSWFTNQVACQRTYFILIKLNKLWALPSVHAHFSWKTYSKPVLIFITYWSRNILQKIYYCIFFCLYYGAVGILELFEFQLALFCSKQGTLNPLICVLYCVNYLCHKCSKHTHTHTHGGGGWLKFYGWGIITRLYPSPFPALPPITNGSVRPVITNIQQDSS